MLHWKKKHMWCISPSMKPFGICICICLHHLRATSRDCIIYSSLRMGLLHNGTQILEGDSAKVSLLRCSHRQHHAVNVDPGAKERTKQIICPQYSGLKKHAPHSDTLKC